MTCKTNQPRARQKLLGVPETLNSAMHTRSRQNRDEAKEVQHRLINPFAVRLPQFEGEGFLDIRVDGIVHSLFQSHVPHANVHEDLVTLVGAIQGVLAAAKPVRHAKVATVAQAAHEALRVDRQRPGAVLEGAERAEGQLRLRVLTKHEDAREVLSSHLHEGEAQIAAQLQVGLRDGFLEVHDSAPHSNVRVPVGVNVAKVVKEVIHREDDQEPNDDGEVRAGDRNDAAEVALLLHSPHCETN